MKNQAQKAWKPQLRQEQSGRGGGSADERGCFEVRMFAAAFPTAGALAASAAATSQVTRREAACPPPIYLPFGAGTCPAWKKVLLHQVEPSHGLVCSKRMASAAAAALQMLPGGCCSSSSPAKSGLVLPAEQTKEPSVNASMRHPLIRARHSLADFIANKNQQGWEQRA